MSYLDYLSIFKRLILIGKNVKRCVRQCGQLVCPVSNKDQFLFHYAGVMLFFFNVYAMYARLHGVFSNSEPLGYGVPT